MARNCPQKAWSPRKASGVTNHLQPWHQEGRCRRRPRLLSEELYWKKNSFVPMLLQVKSLGQVCVFLYNSGISNYEVFFFCWCVKVGVRWSSFPLQFKNAKLVVHLTIFIVWVSFTCDVLCWILSDVASSVIVKTIFVKLFVLACYKIHDMIPLTNWNCFCVMFWWKLWIRILFSAF